MMYKRRPRSDSATPARIQTSTQKSQVEEDNLVSDLPLSSVKRRKETILSDDEPSNSLIREKLSTGTVTSYFEEVVTKAGYIFQEGDQLHLLTRDQAVFIRDVTSLLLKKTSYPQNIEHFISGFEKHCNENSNLKKVLTHTKTSSDCHNARGAMQESLVRLLLSVDCLQPQIAEMLLEKVAEFALTGDDDPDSTEEIPWVRIILRQMRLLDRIVDGKMLNERLFAVLDAAPVHVQREIIFCLPDIIGDDQHHEAALQLSNLLKTNFQLTAAIMEALDSLSLQHTLRIEVCQLMLQVLNKAPPEFLPAIITFLISSDDLNEDLIEVVDGLRHKLDLNPSGGIDGNNQVLLLSALCSGALRCQKLADVWLKAVSSSQNPSDLNPLDVAMLILLHSSVLGYKKHVQNALRSRIKAAVLTEALLEKTFVSLLMAIKEHVKTVLEIGTALFRSPDPAVSYMGSVWFRLMLIHLEGHQSQSVVLELLLLVVTGGTSIANVALGVLAGIECRHLLPHTSLLMGLLDNLQEMDLTQVGQVMDLLSSLVYGTDSLHQDEIHMLIRKHLSSSSDTLKQKGVVGAVMALKHMATSESDPQEDSRSSTSSVDSELSDRASRAKELLELVMESIQNNVTCVGLLYDQLAVAVCSCNTLDVTFLKWITEKTADKFQDYFVKEIKEVSQKGCPQFFLESTEEEYDDAICVDIEGLLKKERSEGSCENETDKSLCVMAPLFRLLRSLQFRISNNLESVDGLLGCYVAMPKDLSDLIDDFPRLNCEEKLLVLDSLFYCINWFRELVNAFSLLRDHEMHSKVLLRIENIIKLQHLLAKALGQAATLNYRPPRCHFHVCVKPPAQDKLKKPEKKTGKGKGKGKGKKKAAENASAADMMPDDSAVEEVNLATYRSYFRELDMEVFTALSDNLSLDKKNSNNDELMLYPETLLFLLEDYVAKLEHCLPSTVKRISSLATTQQAASVGFANLDRIPTALIARRAVKLLTFLLKKLESTALYCQELLDSNDGIYDGPEMFKEGSAEVKLCYGMILRSVASLLGWSGFHSASYSALLRDCLRIIASRQDSEASKITSVKELVLMCCKYFLGYASRTVHLTAAGHLVRILQVLSKYASTEAEPKRKLAETCHEFLSRQWHTLDGIPDHGAEYNQQVESLVKTYLTNTADRLALIESTLTWVEEEVKRLQRKDSCLDTFPTITKANFPILYRSLWSALETATESALKTSAGTVAKLRVWHSVCSIMAVLTNIIKQHEHRTNYHAYIKQSQVILKLFLVDGMPVLEVLLKSKREDIVSMLKILQITTRYLHALCISTKREKMLGLTTYVPTVRKILETLIFTVKGMLVANNCTDAFWMGNLKNKTLKGDEILSQETADDPNEEEDEEMPEDEHSDVDLDNQDNNVDSENEDSVSEVY